MGYQKALRALTTITPGAAREIAAHSNCNPKGVEYKQFTCWYIQPILGCETSDGLFPSPRIQSGVIHIQAFQAFKILGCKTIDFPFLALEFNPGIFTFSPGLQPIIEQPVATS